MMSMRPLPRNLAIPVETLNRELDGKLLLALVASMRGYRPIIGSRTAMHNHLPELPRSIFLSKGVRVGNRLSLKLADLLGHAIVALDEESLVRYNDEALYMMFDEATFNRPRILFAWGEDNARMWRSFTGYRGAPIVPAGNPRIDMLRPAYRAYYAEDADRLRQRYGPFVLISSNFALVNHFISGFSRFRLASSAPAQRSAELRGGIERHKALLFEAFLGLVPDLARSIAPATLVIRPHPSENDAAWRSAAENCPNVHVVHEGPIVPWLMAASALIQNGCTSAIEAAILETPVISFRPVRSDEFDPPLPFAVSREANSIADVIAQACHHLSGERSHSPDVTRALSGHISSLSERMACERILDAFELYGEHLQSAGTPRAWRRVSGFGLHALRAISRGLRTRAGMGITPLYSRHKFPGLSTHEISARIARFHRINPALPELRPRQLYESVFALDPG
jgi:surface carbohydrate biosynthesis protein